MKSGKSEGAPIKVARVLAVLGDHRREVVGRARAAGCDIDRWHASDRTVMAREITRLEDALELRVDTPGRRAERLALREVRRGLEGSR